MISSKGFIIEHPCNLICRHPELIENYEDAVNDTTQTWICHHRLEEFYLAKELKLMGKYYDVSPEELIFVTRKEHLKLPHKSKSVHSANMKGRTAWNKGTKGLYKQTEESNKKCSEKITGRHWKLVDGKRVYDKYIGKTEEVTQ